MPSKGDANDSENGLLLYCNRYSFYSQMVLMALYEKKLSFKEHSIELGRNENYETWFLDINPRGEVPVLKDGVKIIPDSSRIIDYLEDNFSNGNNPRLLSRDGEPLSTRHVAQFRELINNIPANLITVASLYHPELVDSPKLPFIGPIRTYMKAEDATRSDMLRKKAEENPKYKEILLAKAQTQEENHKIAKTKELFESQITRVESTLDEIENQLDIMRHDPSRWLVTDSFTVADISLTVLLERLRQIGLEKRLWENGVRPNVENFYKRASARESFKKTMPDLLFHVSTFIGVKTLIFSTIGLAAIVTGSVFFCVRKWKK